MLVPGYWEADADAVRIVKGLLGGGRRIHRKKHYTTLKKDLLGVMSIKDKGGESWIG